MNSDIEVNVNYIQWSVMWRLRLGYDIAHRQRSGCLDRHRPDGGRRPGVAQEEGVAWFGTQSSRAALGEDIVVASQVYHWEVILDDIVAAMEAGEAGSVMIATLANGGLEIEFNDAYGLDGDVKAAAEATAAAIADGSIATGVG